MPDSKPKNENAPSPAKKAEPEAMKTVYTHGKIFKLPMSTDVEKWLREKYPEEHK